MGVVDPLADLQENRHEDASRIDPRIGRIPLRQLVHDMPQGIATQPLHREIHAARRTDADRVDRHDVRVLQLRRRLRLADKPLDLVDTVLMLRPQRLDGHRTAQRAVLRRENLARAAMRVRLDVLKHRLRRDILESKLVQDAVHEFVGIRRRDRLLLLFVIFGDRRRKW